MSVLSAVAWFFLDNGVGQNLTASALVAVPAALWGRRHLLRLRDLRRQVDELHAHHIRVPRAASDAAQAGLDEAPRPQ